MAWFRKQRFTLLRAQQARDRIPEGMWTKCAQCQAAVLTRQMEENLNVCPKCGHHGRLSAWQRIDQILDPGSFVETHANMQSGDPLGFVDTKRYPDRLAEDQEKTGLREAVVTGYGAIEGISVSVAAMDFGFRGASMGSVVGEKIVRCFEYSLENRVPAVVFCTSGGARMQEGILSLMQMAKTSSLVARLREAAIPYISVLGDPSTAGMMASFGSLGDLVIAEPGALVGFAGPRVIEQTIRQVLPKGFQRSEFVKEHGFIDIIAKRQEMRDTLARVLGLLTPRTDRPGPPGPAGEAERKRANRRKEAAPSPA
ncbi:MAG TPA: acetyl-CoA carboxylase, carboxyltransferase subunit beta [Sumerlaeia bacterium]|nr:acetyl-CoA carboxylase, carboxyltransferase subunit beta [Sumerlaeia bacterium]